MKARQDFENEKDWQDYLRVYFAAKALHIWDMDNTDVKKLQVGSIPNHKIVAKFCVELADALIEELNNG